MYCSSVFSLLPPREPFHQHPPIDRLRTIISYDRICVLDAGQIAEFDTPSNLYQKQGGIFRGMCDQSSITWDDIRLTAKVKEI